MIFVFVRGGLGILFVIAVVHGVLCVGHSSVFTRSCRSCTDVDVCSTLWRSRRRVWGTEAHSYRLRILAKFAKMMMFHNGNPAIFANVRVRK